MINILFTTIFVGRAFTLTASATIEQNVTQTAVAQSKAWKDTITEAGKEGTGKAVGAPAVYGSIPTDLITPVMTDDPPAPGKRVRQVAEEYKGTEVYHTLYLPTNW